MFLILNYKMPKINFRNKKLKSYFMIVILYVLYNINPILNVSKN